jgi:hypothetical protein
LALWLVADVCPKAHVRTSLLDIDFVTLGFGRVSAYWLVVADGVGNVVGVAFHAAVFNVLKH